MLLGDWMMLSFVVGGIIYACCARAFYLSIRPRRLPDYDRSVDSFREMDVVIALVWPVGLAALILLYFAQACWKLFCLVSNIICNGFDKLFEHVGMDRR